MTLAQALPRFLVALDRVPGAREALIGEAVVGDLASWKIEATLWAVHAEMSESLRLIKIIGELKE